MARKEIVYEKCADEGKKSLESLKTNKVREPTPLVLQELSKQNSETSEAARKPGHLVPLQVDQSANKEACLLF